MHEQKKEMKLQALLHQIVVDTQKFLSENSALKFYSVGFDCNAEYAEILLCFNNDGFQLSAYAEILSDCVL